jgi:hypothetical protein
MRFSRRVASSQRLYGRPIIVRVHREASWGDRFQAYLRRFVRNTLIVK